MSDEKGKKKGRRARVPLTWQFGQMNLNKPRQGFANKVQIERNKSRPATRSHKLRDLAKLITWPYIKTNRS